MKGRVLIVAGSDSGGGAGIQADIKAVTALQGFAMSAVTALTAQNTLGVHDVHAAPPAFIARQIEVVLEDLGANCIKTGMLATSEIIETVLDALAASGPDIPVVVDPVMVAKGGASLLADEAAVTLKEKLVPKARLLTPNAPEAEVLIGRAIPNVEAMPQAALDLLGLGAESVLLKGGHIPGPTVVDLLAEKGGKLSRFESPRVDTEDTHGTGCTLASSIATGLAQGMPLYDAVQRGRDYVLLAIQTAPGLGQGHGPLNHGHTVRKF